MTSNPRRIRDYDRVMNADIPTDTSSVIEQLLASADGRWPVVLTCGDYPLDCSGHCQVASRDSAREWMLGHTAMHGGSVAFSMWLRPDPKPEDG